ncbi:peptidase A24 [Microbacterium sp. Root61]|uniref:prepilin peptidase n=1 Tax=Microbacterium sp. Root61 TaxID=1736570 RepID=UPI0006F28869|nr:peptidase A24 [Microbacterium sp. Root61]
MTVSTALLVYLVVVAGLFGLVIGSFLNVVVYRVPAGIPLTRESRCPHCDTAVRWWQNVPVVSWIVLRGKCANCSAPISPRYPLVEAFTGFAFAGIAWWVLATDVSSHVVSSTSMSATVVVLVAFLYFAAISIALTLIDLDTHRLPNAIVLPSYLVAIVLFTIACLLGADWWALGRAGIGMAALYAFYFLLRLVQPRAMGGGDVKLAGVVGLYLGWLGWSTLIVGAFAAFLLGGVFGIILLATRKAGRRTAIPFGPWMIAGAWTGIFAGEIVGRLYGGLYVS